MRHIVGEDMGKKVQVTFTDEQWKIISNLRGKFGNTDAEIVRNVLIAFLSEKSFMRERSK